MSSSVLSNCMHQCPFFGKPVRPQIIKKFPAFNGARRFIPCSQKPAIFANGQYEEVLTYEATLQKAGGCKCDSVIERE
jgi:hypothetical protein